MKQKINPYINSNVIYRSVYAFVLLLIITIFSAEQAYAFDATQTLSAPDNVVVVKHDDKSLKLTWSKVAGAKGYEIYKERKCNCGYKKIKKLRATKYIDNKVGAGNTAEYKVRAYAVRNGKKTYSKFSYTVSAKAYTEKSKSINVTKVKVYLNAGYERAYGIREYAGRERDVFYKKVYAKGKDGKSVKPMCKTVKWFSTDPEIATVDKKGRLRAGVKTGTCYIYARAHNGVKSNNYKVEVKDYAYEKIDIQYAPGEIQDLFNRYEKEIRDIASYYSKNPPAKNESWSVRYWDEDYITDGAIPNDEMIETVKRLVRDSPYDTTVIVTHGKIRFQLSVWGAYSGLSMRIHIGNFSETELGEHWYCDEFVPI